MRVDAWTANAVRELKRELDLKPEDSLLRTVDLALTVIRELRRGHDRRVAR